MHRIWILLVGMWLMWLQAQGQTTISDKRLSYSELIQQIEQAPDSLVVFRNVVFTVDTALDKRFIQYYDRNRMIPADTIVINKEVVFDRVSFKHTPNMADTYVSFHHFHWQKPLGFYNVKAENLDLHNSRFDGFLLINNYTDSSIDYLNLIHSEINAGLAIRKTSSHIANMSLYGNTIRGKNPEVFNLQLVDDPMEVIEIVHNHFVSDADDGFAMIQANVRNFLGIIGNQFDLDLVIAGSIIDGSTTLIDNTFNRHLSLVGVNMSLTRSRIEWSDIKGKIAFINDARFPAFDSTVNKRYLYMDKLEDYEHTYAYRAFIPMYRMLHQILAHSEPRRIANDCYVTMKDLEMHEKLHHFQHNPNFANYFDYQLHRFIRFFSDYGTKPAKGIVVSLYVILFFAAVYFFFPNSWDSLSRNRLISRLRFFIQYFEHKKSMDELYAEAHFEKHKDYESFRDYINSSKTKAPRYIRLLARPVYFFSIFQFKITKKLLKSMDVLKGNWADLSRNQRFFSGLVIGLWLFFVILYDVLIKMLNAITLSVNTFTTLGFGDIPLGGIPRYMAVLEGFIGWFMLSIFSVSLIYQVLN